MSIIGDIHDEWEMIKNRKIRLKLKEIHDLIDTTSLKSCREGLRKLRIEFDNIV